MDRIDSDSVLFNIMNFMDFKSSSQVRLCEKRMKNVMDNDIYWGGPVDYSGKIIRECTQPTEPYHASPGLYNIIMRSSWSGWLCVSCVNRVIICLFLKYIKYIKCNEPGIKKV